MKEKKCPYCKKPVANLVGFCPHCGNKMSEDPKLNSEATLQASADPSIIQKALKERPPLKKQLQIEGVKEAAPVDIDFEKKGEQEEGQAALDEEVSQETAYLWQIAQYGPQPLKWWQSVPYFIRVFRKKRVLTAEVKKIGDICIKKQNDLDSELLILGHLKMKDGDVKKKYPDKIAAIIKAKSVLEEAGEKKITDEQEKEDKETYLNEELTRLQGEIDSFSHEQKLLKEERHQRSKDLKQARAKIQKYNIETDKIKKLMLQQSKDVARPDLAVTERYNFQIREIEGRKTQEEEKARQATYRIAEIHEKLGLVDDKLKQIKEKMSYADQRKSQVLVSLQERSHQVARKFHQFHNEYNKCLRDLAMESYKKNDIPRDFIERKAALIDKIKAAEEADQMLERYLMAQDSYNHEAYKRGLIMLSVGGGISAVLTAAFAFAMYMVFSSLLG